MKKVLQKYSPLQGFYKVDQPPNLCKDCFHMLDDGAYYANIRVLADLGSYASMRQRGLDGSCFLCGIIAQTLQQNRRLQSILKESTPIEMFHASRLGGLEEKWIAGGMFRELSVLVDHAEVCEVLYAHVEGKEGELAEKKETQPRAGPPIPYPRGDHHRWFESLSKRTQVNFETLRFWVTDCEQQHDEKGFSRVADSNVAVLLLDVLDGCLVYSSTANRYLTLSYRWGTSRESLLLTTDQNLDVLQCPGSLTKKNTALPRVIRDSMVLVENIGERYLWVDTLCIVQDNVETMAQNIDRMHLIYGMSLATIVVMSGNSAHDGLPGVQEDSRSPPCNVSKIHNIEIVCRHPGIETVAISSPYETRGWTFQERMLAPRCIIFGDVEVFFLCGSGTYRETANGEMFKNMVRDGSSLVLVPVPRFGNDRFTSTAASQVWGKRTTPDSVPFTYGHGKLDLSRSDFVSSTTGEEDEFEDPIFVTQLAKHALRTLCFDASKVLHDKSQRKEFMLGFFMTFRLLLRDYTQRTLTSSSDILRAFSAISTVLATSGDTDFICGLPSGILDLALLWTPIDDPLGVKRSRVVRVATGKSLYPTWCWASGLGPVDLLVSWRWYTPGDGSSFTWDGWNNAFRSIVAALKLSGQDWNEKFGLLGASLVLDGVSDECPFRSEIAVMGIQDGIKLHHIRPDTITVHTISTSCPAVRLVQPPPPIEVLHIYAKTVSLKALWGVGGKLIITRKTTTLYDMLESAKRKSTPLRLVMSAAEGLTPLSYSKICNLEPFVRHADEHLPYIYDELTEEEIIKSAAHLGIEDTSALKIVLLSTVSRFPPSSPYWQYYLSWPMEKLFDFGKWGFTNEAWVTLNVMLIKPVDDGLVERIAVGHVHKKLFEMAEPEWRYLCIV